MADGAGRAETAGSDRRAPLFILSLLVVVSWSILLYRQSLSILNEDVVWFLTAAGRLLDGGRFGADVVEVNTPIAVLIHAPAVLMTRWFGLSMAGGHMAAVTLMAAAVALLCGAMLRPHLGGRAVLWLGPLAQALFAAFMLQIFQFGQRDCLAGLFLLPAIVLEAARAGRQPPCRLGSIATGLATALALGIKPHYLLVPGVLWLWRCGREGWGTALRAPDIWAAILFALLLGGGALLLCPEWLGVAAEAWRYYAYLNLSYGTLIADLMRERWPLLALSVLVLMGWWRLPKDALFSPLLAALLLAWPGLLAGYLLQAKGFAYHLVPFEMSVELAALVIAIMILRRGREPGVAVVVSIVLALAAGLMAWSARGPMQFFNADTMRRNEVVMTILAEDRGGGMAVLDTGTMPAIYATQFFGTRIAYRAQCPWLLRPMSRAALQGDAALKAAAQADMASLTQGLVADLAQFKPDVVLVNPAPQLADGSSILGFLARDAEFAALWSHYREIGQAPWGGKALVIYARASR